MRDDDDHIGPYNGHNKSEAVPNGCVMVVLVALAFIAVFGAYGFYADWRKSAAPTSQQGNAP